MKLKILSELYGVRAQKKSRVSNQKPGSYMRKKQEGELGAPRAGGYGRPRPRKGRGKAQPEKANASAPHISCATISRPGCR